MDFSKVFKANPYHDELGRFATADGAKFVSIGGKFKNRPAGSTAQSAGDVYASWTKGLSDEQNSALDSFWQGTDKHREFNEWVRSDYAMKGSGRKGERFQAAQDQIDAALSKAVLPEDKKLWRSTRLPGVDLKNAASLVGGTIKDAGYMATTADPEYAKKFSQIKSAKDSFMLEITAKKGTRGVANLGDRKPKLGESEFLFSRNSNLKVTAYDKKTRTFQVEVS